MGNMNKKWKPPQYKIVETKITEMEMNKAFDGLVSRCDIAEERINEPEGTSIETY